ncbi:MCE family protein, partial [Aeromicrobium sp.]|uniref:MCE family protein n=1 Tax=Aeromicrobium sp. TaxID=1871063 RepID=UPI003D6C204B
MLVNVFHDSPGEHRRLLLAGIAFLVSMALLIVLSIAIYDKKFTSSTTVTVMADRAGLQLARFGDVRLHGALVGYVEKIDSDGRRAVITVKLRPEAARTIPGNVDVRILPTTLFGQNYLELVPTDGGTSAGPMRDGTVIPASRVTTNVDLQTILADLFPLLRSVRPADLNATLYALSNALEGKGDQIGDTLVALDDYLAVINEELPTLRTDLRLLSKVSKTYDLAAPDLIRLLRNATVTARTVTQKKGDLARALSSLTGLSRTTRVTLSENEKRLVAQTRTGRPLLALLDTYSPEIPCLLTG